MDVQDTPDKTYERCAQFFQNFHQNLLSVKIIQNVFLNKNEKKRNYVKWPPKPPLQDARG